MNKLMGIMTLALFMALNILVYVDDTTRWWNLVAIIVVAICILIILTNYIIHLNKG
jgi:hypothetical protein